MLDDERVAQRRPDARAVSVGDVERELEYTAACAAARLTPLTRAATGARGASTSRDGSGLLGAGCSGVVALRLHAALAGPIAGPLRVRTTRETLEVASNAHRRCWRCH